MDGAGSGKAKQEGGEGTGKNYSVPTTPHKQVRFIGVVRKYHKCYMVFIITHNIVKILLLVVT